QHVGGADVAGADAPHVAEARRTGDDQAEGYGAEQIAGGQCREKRGEGGLPGARIRHDSPPPSPGCGGQAENTVRPATMVCKTLPCSRAPSKQVFLERERRPDSETIQGSSRSTRAR